MFPPVIELDQARERIGPFEGLLIDAHKAAIKTSWATLLEKQPEIAFPLDDTARANLIHPHIRVEVERRIEDVPGVVVNDKLDFFALMIDDDTLMRFKNVENGAPRNYLTTRQRELASQRFTEEMRLDLLGDASLKPPTLITCGHTLDGAELGRLKIRRDCKGHLPWFFEIYGGEELNAPQVIPTLEDETRPARVRSAQEQEQTTEKGQRLAREA